MKKILLPLLSAALLTASCVFNPGPVFRYRATGSDAFRSAASDPPGPASLASTFRSPSSNSPRLLPWRDRRGLTAEKANDAAVLGVAAAFRLVAILSITAPSAHLLDDPPQPSTPWMEPFVPDPRIMPHSA